MDNRPTTSVNLPALITSGTALAANQYRIGWTIQNCSTNTLYVLMGVGTASTSIFHVALKGCTATNDGSGGSCGQETGVIYTGIITVAGTSPSYTVTEFGA